MEIQSDEDRLLEQIEALTEELNDTKSQLREALEDNEELEAKIYEMKRDINDAYDNLKSHL